MIRNLYARLFRVNLPREWYDIIIWWEARRAAYNLIMFCGGIVGGLVFTIGMLMYEPEGDMDPAIDVVFAAIGANVCYTFGWIVELIVRMMTGTDSPSRGPRLLKAGLIFSLFVFMLPGVVAILSAIRHFI